MVALACVLIVRIETAGGGVRRALECGPMAYLGRVSYGTYLGHWLVIIVATRSFHTGRIGAFAAAVVFGTALAAISYHALERPVRNWRRLDRTDSPWSQRASP